SDDLSSVLTGSVDQNVRDDFFHVPDFASLDLNVRGLSARTAEGLMNHDARVRKGVTSALFACTKQKSTHACRLADTDGADRTAHVLHRVEDRESSGDHAAGRVHVELDVLVGIFALQKQKLRDDDVGDVVVHRATQKDDAVLQ